MLNNVFYKLNFSQWLGNLVYYCNVDLFINLRIISLKNLIIINYLSKVYEYFIFYIINVYGYAFLY
jgi:hypothetical protein